ncbi:AraC family transcriptional regulator [Enterococcus sp. HY326]|uniref:AraC family transcriptional regulator n=1 Tax=Enterococcus sp. HY326 TaxID=2971265 RepID=UPI002240A17D|nr:AraC family transcriptional regulator [Enterococcus sp. HY326]
MDWMRQLNQALDYIEENLTGEISQEKIAEIVHCSSYNFQRLFSYMANQSLSEYIRGHRLTLAAFEILRNEERLLDVAVKYGYGSQDAFSRAFKAFHGVLPSQVRKQPVQLKSCPKLSFQLTIKGEKQMRYQIEEWPAFKVAGYSYPVTTETVFAEVPKIWTSVWENGRINELTKLFQQTDYRPAGFLGVAIGGQWGDSENMKYFIGVTNHVDVPECRDVSAPEGMTEISLGKAKWVVIEANGELPGAVQDVYQQFYREWLPNSGYRLADLPALECYLQEGHQEVWIAVEN